MERHIIVEGGVNVRDLGGYPTAGGRVTRFGRLIRSANLDQLTASGQQTLLDYGMKTDIDLRHVDELKRFPDVFARSAHVRYLHLPFAADDFSPRAEHSRLDGLYIEAFDSRRENIRAIISAIADGEPGILYHCAVGKDRTGMISALLLGNAGVPTDVIAEDYAETTRHIVHLVEEWREDGRRRGDDMTYFDRDVAADAPIMLATLEALERDYGGAVAYLRSVGITEAQLGRLKALLLD